MLLARPGIEHAIFLQVCPYRAGHVLGAAMFLVEIGALKVLYTGDYSRLADRHLSAADVPDQVPDIGARTHMGFFILPFLLLFLVFSSHFLCQ